MRLYENAALYSPTDLVRYLGCAHATSLDLAKLISPEDAPQQAEDDAMGKLVQQAGLEHEDAYRAKLAAEGGLVEIDDKAPLGIRAAATIAAMKDGAKAIFQAAFLQPPWHGFADFLIRVEEPSDLGSWSYEPVDTKLARSTKAAYIIQLGLYARMMASIQGHMPRRAHVELGDGRRESFRLVEFDKVLGAAINRFHAFVQAGAKDTQPEPCAACGLCPWRDHCAQVWEEQDHLSRVCGLGRPQAAKLREAGIETVAALAALTDDVKVPRMAQSTLAKLRAQARLQLARWGGGEPVVETLEVEDGRGFASLPKPDPADLFFDLEGDPLQEGGLDYLWGVHFRDGSRPEFRFRWGHDPEAERVAFEDTLDWMVGHLQRNPGAHVYHYAPYEITSLRRLSTLHASREEALDELLRQRRFVDLYGILRQAIRTSEDNLSLKTMEVFFAEAREGMVTKADQSVVEYKSWQQTGEQKILDDILDYNKVDCENTEALRNWLIELRMDDLPWRALGSASEVVDEKAEARAEAEARSQRLIAAIESGATPSSEEGRALVAHLTQFHRRADKPAFWAMFDRCEREPEELVEDGDCIGAIVPDIDAEGIWQRPEKRSTISSYRFPAQETKLREGAAVLHAPSLQKVGTIVSLDCETGTVEIKRGNAAKGIWPTEGSLIPEPTVPNAILVAAVRRVAMAWAGMNEDQFLHGETDPDGLETWSCGLTDEQPYRALLDLIEREKPRLLECDGGPMVREGESLVEAATLRCLAMNQTTLFIQGPPGTGKTYTSAHIICSLIAAGKRVGVSSNSHKAINNLLAKVEAVAEETGLSFSGVKKCTRGNDDQRLNGRIITDVESASDVHDYHADLVGGTAWLFADENFDQEFDYLFVDEAGQVSLGHLLAMGSAARNIVLVGDQMQLAQPIQGSHPGESGMSVLDYLLQGEATVAPDRGILLDTSWRMHPDICEFISDAVYDGRLKAHPDCSRQRLHLQPGHYPALKEHGLRFVAMDHTGCSQRSDAEVARVRELATALLGTKFTARDGSVGTMGWDNILIVAPYNMQVNALAAALPGSARVGTVDKFQGQEAEVVIVSLTTSTPDDLPRHVEFFYSKNRINVAISRARTLALVLANPKLLELDAKSVDHLRLVNTLAWVAEEGSK
ncbi:MAG: TM0106 family RecB-like putative nuclease [Novosphingobium sp.]|uniref:TM0106 family RecB-like putative nuclease n=1 Tax=Novosphingobium sp. TaxID=1874826 RepID=UPI002623B6D3|nr:TM0106 family RecB-like putative nuclease [Novosphingobium sp.]MCP5385460.1 TM0106 family RecB-like putative nuclease [Novosphingobium sp.]